MEVESHGICTEGWVPLTVGPGSQTDTGMGLSGCLYLLWFQTEAQKEGVHRGCPERKERPNLPVHTESCRNAVVTGLNSSSSHSKQILNAF